jgi:YVTN family beta-propeller protein
MRRLGDGSNPISVIDSSTNTVVATVAVGAAE